MRNKILVVDDSKFNRRMLRDEFEADYEIVEAENGLEALSYMEKNIGDICAVLLDIVMPEMDGIQLLKKMNEEKYMNTFPVIVITSEHPIGVVEECFDYGISDFIRKPINPVMIRRRVIKLIDLFVQKNEFKARVEQQTKTVRNQYALLQKQAEKLRKSNESIIEALGSIVEYRNLEDKHHIKRVKEFSCILAEKLAKDYPEYELNKEKIDIIVATSALHDLGKIFIPDAILLKPGKLTNMEFDYIKSHTIRGAEALEKVDDLWDEEYRKCAKDICMYHHEKWDGTGYPEKLKEDEIPIEAQIVSVADCYDALVTEKEYKKAFSADLAFQMIIRGDCGMFNPKLMECFRDVRRDYEEVLQEMSAD